MNTEMTSCEIRLKAAKLIEEKGICKHFYLNPQGEYCLVGALLSAYGVSDEDLRRCGQVALQMTYSEEFGLVLKSIGFDNPPEAMEYNDTHGKWLHKWAVLRKLKKGCSDAIL